MGYYSSYLFFEMKSSSFVADWSGPTLATYNNYLFKYGPDQQNIILTSYVRICLHQDVGHEQQK